jgi:serine/threonine-protein kinase
MHPLASLSNTSTAVAQPRIGDVLAGNYQLEEVLNAGGMGRVFRGSRLSDGLQVAIKMIHLDDQDETADPLTRFMREAKILMAMQQPHIVKIIDFQSSGEVPPFMVMEFLEGEDMRHWLTKYPEGVPLNIFFLLIKQCCGALDYIHRMDIVHRDLKPDNLMICQRGPIPSIKILDFGLMLAQNPSSATFAQRVTLKGTMVGTPSYMAPEQCMGGSISPATDIYNLGLIAYEMLSGQPVFGNGTPNELFFHQMRTKPQSIRKLRKDVPRPTERAIQSALEKQPHARPLSCGAFWAMMMGKA